MRSSRDENIIDYPKIRNNFLVDKEALYIISTKSMRQINTY